MVSPSCQVLPDRKVDRRLSPGVTTMASATVPELHMLRDYSCLNAYTFKEELEGPRPCLGVPVTVKKYTPSSDTAPEPLGLRSLLSASPRTRPSFTPIPLSSLQGLWFAESPVFPLVSRSCSFYI